MGDKLPKLIVISATRGAVTNYCQGFGTVSCNAESVFDPLAKIEVEESKIDSKYVHLRFRHTNKYWTRQDPGWIFATSNQPEEDISKLSCTLFKPTIRTDGLLYLTHVQSGLPLRLHATVTDGSIYASGATATGFGFIDCDTLVQMPKSVIFKGDNDKYLKAYITNDGYQHLQFEANNSNDPLLRQEVELYPDGHVRIKSLHFGKFWRCNVHNWILANTNDGTPIKETLFWPIKVDGSTIALRAAQNNKFCKRVWIEERTGNCLIASIPTIDPFARLAVEELVLKRDIYNVRYRMEDARIYDESSFVAGTGAAVNETDTESTLVIRVQYEKKRSYSFTTGYSLSTGVTTTFQAGIPFIANAEIKVSMEITANLESGSSTVETETVEVMYTARVPPRSEVVIDYVATRGKCSVPFSYTKKDKSSTDGQFVTSEHTDGIFTGVNDYNFHFSQPALRFLLAPCRGIPM